MDRRAILVPRRAGGNSCSAASASGAIEEAIMHTRLVPIRALTVLAALGIGAPCFAASQSEPSVVVNYADLDLSTTEGARALYQRIQHAAWRVCLLIDATSGIENVRCRQYLRDTAVADVNAPALTALNGGTSVSGKKRLARR
jgi:UrcA family protein